MNQQLEGKVAIVTGASGGIGSETVRLFAARGCRVLATDFIEGPGQTLAEELGGDVFFVRHDVTREEDWQRVVSTAVERFGKLNVLANVAGVVDFCPLEKCTEERFRRVIDINLVGVFLGMKHAATAMREAGGGSIINISSVDGLRGTNCLIAYNASKWAVRGMSKSAAMELGRANIRVNSVHPGGINTSMGNPGQLSGKELNEPYRQQGIPRVGEPIEIARTLAFLASDEASYTTGGEYAVDGGMTAGWYTDLTQRD